MIKLLLYKTNWSLAFRHCLVFAFVSFFFSLFSLGCDQRSVGGSEDKDGGKGDGSLADGQTNCVPGSMDLDCVEIQFPSQQNSFTQAEATAGISFVWELVVPETLTEVYPTNPDPNCCLAGVGPLKALAIVFGNSQYYCDCDHGTCDPSGCETPPAMQLPAGLTTEVFFWPGVNWNGPSDTNEPYGPPFLRGTYLVRVVATGQWVPSGTTQLKSYRISGEIEFEIIDGCGGRPALEDSMRQCAGVVGEGGFCIEITVDDEGQPVGWEPEYSLDPALEECLEDAISDDCYPSIAGSTETICIYGP